ncbi:G-protein coupled receptor 35 isoform X1 [Cynoglossus semilaevis]|uniref:G-protein coupled receptor 35 isoform X1 n=1 Tax=Cynoglossus semilaevis TaxID=244447 RepID=UPI000495AD69|nr:G-protein coupled receptor 35-like isoform X1 [Cynoglossus semilaevis]
MNNNSLNANCTVEVLQGVAYSPVFIVGLLVNAAALRAFISKRDSFTDTHIYMFNMVIADSAIILVLPFRIYDAFFCLPKTYMCTVLLYVHFVNMYVSILTVTTVSVQRYLAIRFPLQVRVMRRKKVVACAVCLFIWALILTICVVFRKENYPDNLWTCFERCKDRPLRLATIVILDVTGFLIPLVIIVFCSSQVITVLLKADKDQTGTESERRRSITGVISANMIIFIVCYTPIHVAFLVNFLYTPPPNWHEVHTAPHVFLLISEWIAATNCCFDSISYYFLLKQFYSAAKLTHGSSSKQQPRVFS